jgi:hypothetical protein
VHVLDGILTAGGESWAAREAGFDHFSEAPLAPDEWWDDLYADPTRNFGGWATSIRSSEETAAMQRDLVRIIALPLLGLWLLLLVILHVLEI